MNFRKISDKQEKRILKSFKQICEEAKQTINSGAMWFSKSDIITKLFRVEAKTKVKPSNTITLRKEWFDKIQLEAYETNKIGLVAFSFGDEKDYIALESEDFISLMEELIELRKELEDSD